MASFTSGGMLKTSIVIDQELLRMVDGIAAEQHISRSDALRTLMRKGVDAHRREQSILAAARQSNATLPLAS